MAKAKAPETDERQSGDFVTARGQIVVSVPGEFGGTHYAWRSDGKRPEFDPADFARNKNAALIPSGTANFASTVKPE